MARNLIFKVLGVFLLILTSFSLISATQDFSVTPSSFSLTSGTGQSGGDSFIIENTGNEIINLSISKVDLTDGSNTIILSLGQTSVTNLADSTTQDISFTYTAGTIVGTFTGSITVVNSNNFSQSITIPVSVEVTQTLQDGPSVAFLGYSSTLTMIVDVDDSSEKETFYLVNDGNETLTEIEIDLDTKFDGDDDDIEDNDFEINGEPGEDTFKLDDDDVVELAPGEEYKVKLDLDIPSSLDVDTYKGDIKVSFEANGVSYVEEFTLKIITESDNEDVFIDHDTLDVRDGVLSILAEPGETIDDIEVRIENDAGYDLEDLELEIEDDFEEETSSNEMSRGIVEFDQTTFDIDKDDEEDIELTFEIPDDQPTGTYVSDLYLKSSSGKELDKIRIEVKVVGDIYIKDIRFNDALSPGDDLNVEVEIGNKGSQTYRNVRVVGSIFDIDSVNSDLFESSTNFLLEVDDERVEYLRFKIPEDANDGAHTLEIKVTYDDNEITDVETVEVSRPTHKMKIESFAVTPNLVKCEVEIFTYMKVQNLGKYDEDVIISAEIKGTPIKQSSSEFELEVDERTQKNLVLDISSLDVGTYDLVQKVSYGSSSVDRTSELVIKECIDSTVSIEIEELNETTMGNETISSEDKVELFGTELQKTTVYLGTGLGLVVILIIISLFLL